MRFFEKAIGDNDLTETVTMDKSGATKAAIAELAADRKQSILVRQVKYLNDIVEQDHRAVKAGVQTRPPGGGGHATQKTESRSIRCRLRRCRTGYRNSESSTGFHCHARSCPDGRRRTAGLNYLDGKLIRGSFFIALHESLPTDRALPGLLRCRGP